jgi:hypothetical protein
MFTFVGLAQFALFTELSHDPLDRIKLTIYQQIGYLIGSSSVLLLEHTSDSLHDFRSFQITAFFITIVVGRCFDTQGIMLTPSTT